VSPERRGPMASQSPRGRPGVDQSAGRRRQGSEGGRMRLLGIAFVVLAVVCSVRCWLMLRASSSW